MMCQTTHKEGTCSGPASKRQIKTVIAADSICNAIHQRGETANWTAIIEISFTAAFVTVSDNTSAALIVLQKRWNSLLRSLFRYLICKGWAYECMSHSCRNLSTAPQSLCKLPTYEYEYDSSIYAEKRRRWCHLTHCHPIPFASSFTSFCFVVETCWFTRFHELLWRSRVQTEARIQPVYYWGKGSTFDLTCRSPSGLVEYSCDKTWE